LCARSVSFVASLLLLLLLMMMMMAVSATAVNE